MKIQKEFSNGNLMYGVEEPWCNNQGVAILPYAIKDNEYHYLLLSEENNPLFKNKQISKYSTITGGLENNNFIKTVLNEMFEETGINDISKFNFLGTHYANKSSRKLWLLFAIDLSKSNLDLDIEHFGKSDGTDGENGIKGKFVSYRELNETNDLLALAIYGKLHLFKENELIQSQEISITLLEENKKIQKLVEDNTSSFWKEINLSQELSKIKTDVITINKKSL